MEAIVIVRCINCGLTREVGPNEIPAGEMPMCKEDGGIMIAEEAKIK